LKGPLQGIRVIDMTTMLLGPYATQIMGDLGADIIKVEPPQGDGRRTFGPSVNPLMTSQHLHVNRSKRSIVMDLKQAAGREALLILCKTADVLVHNMRSQAMRKLNLTYSDITKVNPRIVYCGAFGYGNAGPYADRPAYDDLIQGLVAIPYLNKQMGGGAAYVPLNICDRNCGMAMTYNVLAALLARERTGEGQEIEVTMFETMAEYVLSEHMWGRTFVPAIDDMGATRLFDRRPLTTKDGYITVQASSDAQFERFIKVIGRAELKDLERFSHRAIRYKHLPELFDIFDAELSKKTTSEWADLLMSVDVPFAPIHTLESLMDDPHLREIGFIKTIEHPSEGKIRSFAVTSRWSKTAPENERHAPLLGEHTLEILHEAGFTANDIEALAASGAVRQYVPALSEGVDRTSGRDASQREE